MEAVATATYTGDRARRFLIRALSRIHARAYRISRGRILDRGHKVWPSVIVGSFVERC